MGQRFPVVSHLQKVIRCYAGSCPEKNREQGVNHSGMGVGQNFGLVYLRMRSLHQWLWGYLQSCSDESQPAAWDCAVQSMCTWLCPSQSLW